MAFSQGGEVEETGTLVQGANDVASDAIEFLDKVYAGETYRLTLGLGASVDKETAGCEPENLIIVAGETKGGKTLTAINTVYANLYNGKRVLVVTTEVSALSYLLRLVSRHTQIPLASIRDKSLSIDNQNRVKAVLGKMRSYPLYKVERPLCTIGEIEKAIHEVEPDIVIVDHLQRLQTSGDNYVLGLKNITLKLKNLAVVKRLPIILLSQVSFGEGWCEESDEGELTYHTERMYTRWSREPVMEADKVFILHNLGLHNPSKRGEANFIIHSMRDYASGEVLPMKIRPEHQFLGDYNKYRMEYATPSMGGPV